MEIFYSDKMQSRNRIPELYFMTGAGVVKFEGKTIPGIVAVKASRFEKNGKWSGTDFTMEVVDTVMPVLFSQPFDGWGRSWVDHAEAVTVKGEGRSTRDVEPGLRIGIARAIMRKHWSERIRVLAEEADYTEEELSAIQKDNGTPARWLLNAFSLGMCPVPCEIVVAEVKRPEELSGYLSAIGHPATAAILGVECNRETVRLDRGETVLVAQYDGPRLPEGATELPEGASFRWLEVTVK